MDSRVGGRRGGGGAGGVAGDIDGRGQGDAVFEPRWAFEKLQGFFFVAAGDQRPGHDYLGRGVIGTLREGLPRWQRNLPQLPDLVYEVLSQARDGRLELKWHSKDLQELRRELRRAHQRTLSAVVGGSLVVAAAVLLVMHAPNEMHRDGIQLLGWAVGVLGAISLAAAWTRNQD